MAVASGILLITTDRPIYCKQRHQMSKTKEESSKIYSTKTPEDMSAVLLDESKY